MLSSLKDIRGLAIQDQKQIFDLICAKAKLYSSVIAATIKDEAANVFLEISPHPVLATSIRECYELTKQQQQSSPLILLTLKRKENEQITLLTTLAQLTTLSQTLHGTLTTIISQLSNDDKNCSSSYLVHSYLVILLGIETIFLPVRIQKFIYSSKTKAKMNRSTNVEVRGKYHDNICEPIFTFEGAVIQQVQGAHSGRWSLEQIIYDK
ncbi:unnamed protein product [Adineta steineri]|uniref:Uncharacterized protein n=1 Tax=Adineta steineri TaxID=433720 RepID=A0A819YU93_9BILA|nr:unnamed protein product [Adineta steineri]CAF3921134.1 unnamed protein product [Adineta steineri]CAF4160931.1 unnamed protein product [Adineta steineri]CAF4179401.1 unnamed protein product [Adineta steineri]